MQQRLCNAEIVASILFDSTLALGQLSYESGAFVKACQKYSYGPAYIRLAAEYVKRQDKNYIFKAVECYCQAMLTAYQPMVKEALGVMESTFIADIKTDQKSCFIIIETLVKFIDANKSKITELEIPLLLKLIQGLKLEKLFFEPATKTEAKDKFELFTHKFSSKTHFSTVYARAFMLLTAPKNIKDTWEIIEEYGNEKIIAFYQEILDNQSGLPFYLINAEIYQRINQILFALEENLLDTPMVEYPGLV